jgi:hypothetical protein
MVRAGKSGIFFQGSSKFFDAAIKAAGSSSGDVVVVAAPAEAHARAITIATLRQLAAGQSIRSLL